MARIRLIHWCPAEAEPRIQQLQSTGYATEFETVEVPDLIRRLRQDPPDAVIIDLSRLPSHGRDLAVALRTFKSTRRVPLVFAGGDPAKVARLQELLPDATYGAWDEIAGALLTAIAHPPVSPIVPESRMAGYSGAPLIKKLGIKPGSAVGLVAAPPGFLQVLGELPCGAAVRDGMADPCSLVVWFVRSRGGLERDMAGIAGAIGDAPLWIAWPKKGSGQESDLVQQGVRDAGMAAGLVDYKICSIDETWSALLFRRRDSERRCE